MPLYEYKCLGCGTVSEVIQRMSDDPLTTCERCGGELKKLLSAPAFQFKGSGWYVTDYANKSGGDNGKSGSEKGDSKGGSDATSESGDSSKSESKSSSKSEALTKAERVSSS